MYDIMYVIYYRVRYYRNENCIAVDFVRNGFAHKYDSDIKSLKMTRTHSTH